MSSPFRLVLFFAMGAFAIPPPEPKHKFSNITLDIALTERAADPINLPNLKMPSGGLPSVSGVTPTTAACPPASNQSNQCSTGIPYCCSPDGDGGASVISIHKSCVNVPQAMSVRMERYPANKLLSAATTTMV
jgi:hypothetical protein